jgi:hypothetical protein
MRQTDIITLFERIKNNYNMFTYNDDKVKEWYRFLKDYSKEDVNKNLDNYITTGYENPPLVYSLIKNIPKIEEPQEKEWVTRCDLCGAEIRIYGDDMSDFDKHYRKCQKIDFIDRMSKKYRGTGVAIVKYYEMSNEELDKHYRKIMDFYVKHREETNLLKEIPEEE